MLPGFSLNPVKNYDILNLLLLQKALHIRQAVGLHFPKGGEAMRITFHIGEFTITIIVKKR